MKKKLLFVMNNLDCGGAEKALLSLLETIDYSKYEVDLFLFKHQGLFFNKLPKQVNLLIEPSYYKLFDMPIKAATIHSLKRGRPILALNRILAGYIFRKETHPARREQRTWKYVSLSLPQLEKQYDAAIGYLEKNPVYFVVEKVKAIKKIGYIHNDYDKLGMDPVIDRSFFVKLDHLVTVSDECGKVLENRFIDLKAKVKVIQNIVSPEVIHKMALEKINWDKTTKFRIVSVGRLNDQKGFDMAVEACNFLIKLGYDLNWYVLGEGEERNRLERSIKQFGLEDKFILLGLQENPYPYIMQADIYVQPSRFEGKSIAIDEAKILHKPIIVTQFTTAGDQIQSSENGLIVEMNAEAIGKGIKQLLDDNELRHKFAERLANENLGTESEIEKLYQLL